MKKTFCTLFDHNYFYKGLCLYHSLKTFCPEATLWILALSDVAFQLLHRMQLANVQVIRLEDLEDDDLRRARANRGLVEYYWTLSPSLPLYVLEQDPTLDEVTYLDADCLFFADPEPLYREMGDDSVLIIEHRYSAERKAWEKTSGRFNVQMLVFKRDEIGLSVLRQWRAQCNEWCYYREEEGRFGDQMYLDRWPEDFPGIHILQHKGGGLAPWNLKNYRLSLKEGAVWVDEDPLIFYHYHAFRMFPGGRHDYAHGYRFTKQEIDLIYRPYLAALARAKAQVAQVEPSFCSGYAPWEGLLSRLRSACLSKVAALAGN